MHCKMVEAQEYDIGTQAAETLDIWNYRNGLGRASGGEGGRPKRAQAPSKVLISLHVSLVLALPTG
jgi:hypothetical protein